jgi:hypothetical protein
MITKFEKIKMSIHEAYWLVDNGVWVGTTGIENIYRISQRQLPYVGQLRKWWSDKEEARERKRNRR